jgi:putative glutamine amidotransferase
VTRILVNTWRRQGQVFGPVVRDMFGAEVAYAHVVQASGAVPFLVPRPHVGVGAEEVLDGFDGLLLIGGEDLAAEVSGALPETVGANADPDRDRWEIALLTAALESGVPVLAICRGMQLLNVAFGGTLHGHMTGESPEHPPVPDELAGALGFRHRVDVAAHSRVHRAIGAAAIETNSLHHQAVDRLGDGLIVTGRASDGVVEALEPTTSTWCVGVQWHPELMADDVHQRALVNAFVDTCRARRARTPHDLPRRSPTPRTERAS